MLLFSGSTVYSQATELRVAVSIPPQQWLVTQIGGDLVSTEILLDAGQSPHTFIPTPKQITGLFDADIYFLIGMAFEKQVSKKIKQADNHPRLIDTTLSIKKIPILHNYGEGKPCAYGAFHPAGNDPHVWLCHTNLRIMAEAMADALSDADPKNSIAYKENLEKLTTLLNRSDEQIRENLLPLKGETFFVFHPAFGYFAHAYGLKQKAVEVEGKIPTPKKLTALIKKIKNTPVRVIFIQPGFDHRAAQIIADAIDGNLVTINPLAENVVKTMHTLAKEIRKQKG
jgi:zinc transport system substrate-binding protein